MDNIKEILREKIFEAVGNVDNNTQQNNQQQKNTNNQEQPQQNTIQQQNNQQQQTTQVQGVENKFNEISKLLNNIVNNGNVTLQNATKEFVNGITYFTKCSNGFNQNMKDTLAAGMGSFKKGNEELGKLTNILKNIQQLSQNITTMTGGNNSKQ